MRSDVLNRFVAELSRSSPDVISSRKFYASKFVDFAGDDLSKWNKETVFAFLKQLEYEGYAPGTCRNIYSIVKRTFDVAKAVHETERIRLISGVNPTDPGAFAEVVKAISLPGPSWDMGKRAAPKVETKDVVRPAVTHEELTRMIEAIKEDGTPSEKCYLLLSSVYGLRREELCRLRPEHFNFDAKTFFVSTAKGGEQRWQLLCDVACYYLRQYDFSQLYTAFGMTRLFWIIWARAGFEQRDGYGWHSIRRYLDTILVDTCGEIPAHLFLRWKISSSSLMVVRYYSADVLQNDANILSNKHPVVPLWNSGL